MCVCFFLTTIFGPLEQRNRSCRMLNAKDESVDHLAFVSSQERGRGVGTVCVGWG